MTGQLVARLRDMVFASRFYDVALGNGVPTAVSTIPFSPARSAAACDLADGRFPATLPPKSEVKGNFRWLAAHVPDQQAATVVADWLKWNRRWNTDSWRIDILAERLSHWLNCDTAMLSLFDGETSEAWRRAIARGAKHLTRAHPLPADDWRRLLVRRGQLAASLALDAPTAKLGELLRLLGEDVDTQILADGGHRSRRPSVALAALSLLIDMRDMLSAGSIEPPVGLVSAIDRMVPFIKGLCHGDGSFALLQGTTSEPNVLIEEIIAASGCKGRAMSSAPHTGFHRLRAAQTALIVDSGATPGRAAGLPSAASFELSTGRTRLIGGCGMRLTDTGSGDAWRDALSRTAAQSTLVIDDRDGSPAAEAHVERRDQDGARLIEISHDAYRLSIGIHHRRLIYLSADGTDIRGEDVLSGGGSRPFSVRFHLHPEVRASMVAGGGEVILKPPKGRGWRFHCRYPVMLEDSVNFFDGRQHRAQQIVILGNHEPSETTVKWRLAMEK